MKAAISLLPKEFLAIKKSSEAQDLLEHPKLQMLLGEKTLPKEAFERAELSLRRHLEEQQNCENCPGLAKCPNLCYGHSLKVRLAETYFDFYLAKCDKLRNKEALSKEKSLVSSHHIPREVETATFDALEHDLARAQAIEAAIDFCAAFVEGVPRQGLYFYGPLGTGKSMLAGAIAQDLIRYGVDSYMVYVPEFMREIKRSLKDNVFEQKVAKIKQATVVIFDDLGAEVVTAWTRDEIFGAIVQHRTSQHLPTVYTSNLNLNELEHHLAHDNKGNVAPLKAKRIMERIRHFVRPVLVPGRNRRIKE
ncbi:MAG: primosomal protein DnaI [Bacillota bacterium]